MLRVLSLILLVASCVFAQDGDLFGLQRGSVGAFVEGGPWISGGTHPFVGGGVDFGFARYVGMYVDGGYGLAYGAKVGAFSAGSGIMIAATNKTRIVPFGKFGAAYDRTTLFGYGGVNVPEITYGGGVDGYLTKHFGLHTQVTGGRSVGRFGGSNSATIGFGIFYRSK